MQVCVCAKEVICGAKFLIDLEKLKNEVLKVSLNDFGL